MERVADQSGKVDYMLLGGLTRCSAVERIFYSGFVLGNPLDPPPLSPTLIYVFADGKLSYFIIERRCSCSTRVDASVFWRQEASLLERKKKLFFQSG